MEELFLCKGECKKELPFSDFYFRKARNYRLTTCKKCMNKAHRKYYLDNKKTILAVNKLYRETDNGKEKCKNAQIKRNNSHKRKEYVFKNKDRIKSYMKEYGIKNKEKLKIYADKYYKTPNNRRKINSEKSREKLADSYIKNILASNTTLSAKDIPQDLIELKRTQILLHREIRKNPLTTIELKEIERQRSAEKRRKNGIRTREEYLVSIKKTIKPINKNNYYERINAIKR